MTAPATTRLPSRRAFAAGIAAILVAGRARFESSAQEATPRASPPAVFHAIEISGDVASPGMLSVSDLQALPAETVDVRYLLEDGTKVQHTYTGARLWDVLQLAEPLIDPEQPETSLHKYVVLTASDGYVVVISLGEIDPEFGARPYLLAWEEDDRPLSGEQGPAMLVPAGDRTEGRYIWGVVSIDVRSVETNSGA
jgi:DMSO/TMAO reductase YedYZ molybdopterin-dependent catalytic subunit